jgi:GDP/UDP-N,N'-diacetylbacillosamine 2-epimerase (hydrolysing)
LYSKDFQNIVKDVKNPYGLGGASKKIISKIKDINLDGIIKKSFYDLKESF